MLIINSINGAEILVTPPNMLRKKIQCGVDHKDPRFIFFLTSFSFFDNTFWQKTLSPFFLIVKNFRGLQTNKSPWSVVMALSPNFGHPYNFSAYWPVGWAFRPVCCIRRQLRPVVCWSATAQPCSRHSQRQCSSRQKRWSRNAPNMSRRPRVHKPLVALGLFFFWKNFSWTILFILAKIKTNHFPSQWHGNCSPGSRMQLCICCPQCKQSCWVWSGSVDRRHRLKKIVRIFL